MLVQHLPKEHECIGAAKVMRGWTKQSEDAY